MILLIDFRVVVYVSFSLMRMRMRMCMSVGDTYAVYIYIDYLRGG